MTVKLRLTESRCLWNELSSGEKGEISVFVESAGTLRARLVVTGPYPLDSDGVPMTVAGGKTVHDSVFSSEEKTTGLFAQPTRVEFVAEGPGAYRACLDNAKNRFDTKVVSIDFRTSGEVDEDELPIVALRRESEKVEAESVAELTNRLLEVRKQIAELKDKQARERRRLAHHRALNEASQTSLVEGSVIETLIYIFACTFQIIYVRNWFEGKSVTNIFGSDNV